MELTEAINSITVEATGGTDAGSGIAGYQYSTDGVNWTETIPSGTSYTFTGFKSDTEVTIYAKTVDEAGNTSGAISQVGRTTTISSNVSLVKPQNSGWTNEDVNVTVSHSNIPTGYELQYKKGNEAWTNIASGGIVAVDTNNTTVYGRLYNNAVDDEIGTNSVTVSNIDKNPPSTPTDLTGEWPEKNVLVVQASGSTDTGGSNFVGYQYSTNGTNWSNTIASGTSYTVQKDQNMTVYARAIDGAGNTSESIIKGISTVSAKGKDITQGHDEVITATVPSNATGRVYALIDGLEYYGEILNGKTKIVIENLPAEKYIAKIWYEGDDYYLISDSTETKFTVTKSSSPSS